MDRPLAGPEVEELDAELVDEVEESAPQPDEVWVLNDVAPGGSENMAHDSEVGATDAATTEDYLGQRHTSKKRRGKGSHLRQIRKRHGSDV